MPTSAKDDVHIIWLHTIASFMLLSAAAICRCFFIQSVSLFCSFFLFCLLFHFILHEWSSTNTFEVLIYLFCIWNINNNNSSKKKMEENALCYHPWSMQLHWILVLICIEEKLHLKIRYHIFHGIKTSVADARYCRFTLFYGENEEFCDIFIPWSRFN